MSPSTHSEVACVFDNVLHLQWCNSNSSSQCCSQHYRLNTDAVINQPHHQERHTLGATHCVYNTSESEMLLNLQKCVVYLMPDILNVLPFFMVFSILLYCVNCCSFILNYNSSFPLEIIYKSCHAIASTLKVLSISSAVYPWLNCTVISLSGVLWLFL